MRTLPFLLSVAAAASAASASAQTAYLIPCGADYTIREVDFGTGTVTALWDGGIFFWDASANGTGSTFYAVEPNGALHLVDVNAQSIFQLGIAGAGGTGIAFDPGSSTLYGTDFNNLYTIDTGTAVATLVGSHGGVGSVWGMTYDVVRDRLLGCTSGGLIHEIDTGTGAATLVGGSGFTNLTDLWVDPLSGRMFATQDFPGDLFELDPLTGAAVVIGPAGNIFCGIGATGGEVGGFGQTYCSPAVPNSTGQPGRVAVSGSPLVANNTLVLTAFDLPPNEFGYFLVAAGQAFLPNAGGSQGTLCLALPIGRYANRVQSSGNGGAFAIQADLTALPLTPTVAVQAGETWSFQAWYRDQNPTATSNFTDAVAVTFQ